MTKEEVETIGITEFEVFLKHYYKINKNMRQFGVAHEI